jgi:hypothetical protein
MQARKSFQKNTAINIKGEISVMLLSFIERVTFNPLSP